MDSTDPTQRRGRWPHHRNLAPWLAVIGVGLLIAIAVLVAVATSGTPSTTVTTADAPPPVTSSSDERVAGLQASAEELRKLSLGRPVVVEHLDRAGVEALVQRLQEEDLELSYVHALDQALHLMGQLPSDVHLDDLATQGLSQQVAGLYDPASKRLYVVDGENAEATDSTLVHEIVHALQDEEYGLEPRTRRARILDADGTAAWQAVLEGDATEVQTRFLREQGLGGVVAELSGALAMMSEVPEAQRQFPPYLQRSLEFPYLRGAQFMATLRREGGEAAVDEAFANPPRTTLAIVDPDWYLSGNPAPVRVRFPAPRQGASRVLGTTFGVADLMSLGVPESVATSWRGGRIALDRKGRSGVLRIWVHSEQPKEMARALRRALPRSAQIRVVDQLVAVRITGRLPKA